MEPVDDSALLRQFAENHSDEAFAELVTRHVNLVYSVALRQVGHPQNAEEITQAVFIILAKKAAGLRHEKALSSWLFQATRFTAINFVRSEIRRRQREQEAQMQTILNESGGEVWPKIAPLLDDAVAALREKERRAIVLRFYEGRSLREVGLALGASEEAAKKRVGRALEKLRQFFAKRGVDSTTAAIAETISAHSVQIAPLALAKTISAVAVAKGATASISTLSLIKGALKIMAWAKAKTAIVAGSALLLMVGTTTIVIKEIGGGDSTNEQVLEIVRTNADDSIRGADLIAKIGPKALPTLERLVRWKKSSWDFFDTTSQEKMRASAIGIASRLGPAGVRPLTSALCEAVDNPDITDLNTILPACNGLLHCSVPESPQAVATLTNWLANPARWSVIGYWDDDFGSLPNATSLLIPWLKHPGRAYEIAHYLGSMGTNAADAIPTLIEVCRNGIDTNPPPLKLPGSQSYIPKGKKKPVMRNVMVQPVLATDQKARNRGYALEALGEIGIASPEVVATLQRSLSDTNDVVRLGALKAIYSLHLQPEEPLADVLNGFIPRRGTSFNNIVNWVGNLGDEGRGALPWLQRLTAYNYVQSLPEGIHADTGWDFAVPTETLRESAILAICEIDPSQIKPAEVNGAELLHRFSANWEATKRVRSESNATSVLAILTPMLGSTNAADASLAAYVVLGIAPGNQEALQTLHRCATDGNPNDRLFAAEWLWDETGDSTNLLNAAIEGVKSTDTAQLAPQLLAKMGDKARPAIPALKDALWGQDTFARYAAGDALRKIAPDQLPPIQ
jgi:RNA polymerase sigma factor (sigma-70 family)